MKRIFLFLATNLAVILLLTLVINLLGLDSYLDARMGNYVNLLIFAAVIGFGGAFISLAMSKWMAKMSMGVQVIAQPANETERWLLETVRRIRRDRPHRHARSRHFRFADAQRVCHRRAQECRARGREHRPAAQRCAATKSRRWSDTRSRTSPMATW